LQKPSGEARYINAAANAVHRLSGQFQDHPEAWASAITSLNRYPLPPAGQNVTATNTATSPPASFRVPVSADHVHVASTAAERDAIRVTLKVDDQYHINANPASLDYLMPTALEIKGMQPLKIEYPKPIRFTAKFARDGLDVYEGSISIIAMFSKGDLKNRSPIQGVVTVQACTSQICLPPSELPVSVNDSRQ